MRGRRLVAAHRPESSCTAVRKYEDEVRLHMEEGIPLPVLRAERVVADAGLRPLRSVAGSDVSLRRAQSDGGLSAEVLWGEGQIRPFAEEIDAFVARCADKGVLGGALVWMRDVLAEGSVPIAVIMYRGDRLEGVALASELTRKRKPCGLAACGNMTGQRGLFTESGRTEAEIVQTARAAADAILSGGMKGLLLSVKAGAGEGMRPMRRMGSSKIAACAQRDVYDTFDLKGTFDESVARLGAHTRRNLRYYRRRAQKDLACEFLPAMDGQVLRDAVLELQVRTDDLVKPGVAKNRIAQVMRNPQAFCMGVRAQDGRWLSWLSGWRDDSTTFIDWQCNRNGMPRYSLSTVMRSYLIEHECALGQRQLRFLGGTPHTMHYGFGEDVCVDWLVVPSGVYASVLSGVAPVLRWLRKLLRGGSAAVRTRSSRRSAASAEMVLLRRMAGVLMQSDGRHTGE
jgi:hypothetical protein